jgi:hypothetical protein
MRTLSRAAVTVSDAVLTLFVATWMLSGLVWCFVRPVVALLEARP